MTIEKFKNLEFVSFYNVDKLNSLFKNLDTISFIELLTREKNLIMRGYEKQRYLKKLIHFLHCLFFLV